MNFWGKIIGGAIGFAVGNIFGAVLGVGVGHAVDTGLVGKRGKSGQQATQKITFTIAVIALSAKMAKADGQVTREEVEAFKEVFHIPPHEMKNVGRVFDMAREDIAGYESYARQVARIFADQPNVLEDLVGALMHIAKADNVIHPSELEFLKNVAEIFGFVGDKYEAIKARHLGPDEASPYTILEVSPSDTDLQIKAAYRKLIKEHHPDRLIAAGVPEEFIEVANERLAAINEAYDRIAAERGIK